MGKVDQDRICCPYHGWEFDRSGACVHVPQLKAGCAIPANYQVDAHHCTERYGYIWVCLDQPIMDIPELPEADDPGYRLIQEGIHVFGRLGVVNPELQRQNLKMADKQTFRTLAMDWADYDVPLMPSREEHMFTDRPGIMIRKKVAALLKAHGESEQSYQQTPNADFESREYKVPEKILF